MGGEYMRIQKNIITTLAILFLGLTPVVATVPAYAASTTTTQSNFFQGLVSFIAQKFGLDATQVQSAVTSYTSQQKQTRQQNMHAQEKTHLDSLVTKGTITSTQEQQILDEQSKLRSEYNPANFKSLSAADRKTQMQKEQAEIQAWSQSTGISAQYLRPGFGMRMRMFNRWNNVPTPTPGS